MARVRAFISYAHTPADKATAEWVASSLAGNGVDVWWDQKLRAEFGGELNAEICQQIDAADYVIVLVSGMSLSSEYCRAEMVRAMAKDRPIIRVDLEVVVPEQLPGALLPLVSQSRGVANFHQVSADGWALALANAAAERGLKLETLFDDPLDLGPGSRIIRPNYLRLRGESAEEWRGALDRLVSAQALAPDNGYSLLNLSLLRLYMGNVEAAAADAEGALRQLPREPDAHFALALAACRLQPPDRRSKPEADRILGILSSARRLDGAGAHLALLAAAVIANYYRKRFLTEPESVEAVLEEGLSYRVFDREENIRVWDLEPINDTLLTAPVRGLLQKYGVGAPA